MSQIPTNRTSANSVAEHLSDHNELHRLHNVYDGHTPLEYLKVINATDATYGLSTGGSGAANTAALQAAIEAAHSGGFGTVYIPEGTYSFDLVTHPNSNATWTKTVAAVRAGLIITGAGPFVTILKVINAASLQAGSQNRFFINWDPDADVAVDVGIYIKNLTINGNCVNVGGSSTTMHGIQFWNARRCYIENVHVKNIRGNDTSTNETFHIDFVRCQDVGISDCRVFTDDTGNTASGISMNFTDRFFIQRSSVIAMKNGQGYTFYSSANGLVSDCYAGGNGAVGFNVEQSWDIQWVNCDSGAESARTDSGTNSAAYTHGASNANDRGFVVLMTHGGGRLSFTNCNVRSNTTRGVGVTAAVAATAGASTSGTSLRTASGIAITAIAVSSNVVTATYTNVSGVNLFNIGDSVTIAGVTDTGFNGTFTVTGAASTTTFTYSLTKANASSSGGTVTANVFYSTMIGNYAKVGANGFVKITGYTSSTQVTTETHGGSPGDAIVIQGGQVYWSGGFITGNGKGIQFTGATTALKQQDAHVCDFTTANIFDNTTDLENVGDGSSTSVTRATGLAPSANTSNLATTVEFYNPFPMDMWVIISGTLSSATLLRGRHPEDTAQSMGLQTGTFLVKAGGAITITGSSIGTHWVFA